MPRANPPPRAIPMRGRPATTGVEIAGESGRDTVSANARKERRNPTRRFKFGLRTGRPTRPFEPKYLLSTMRDGQKVMQHFWGRKRVGRDFCGQPKEDCRMRIAECRMKAPTSAVEVH